MLAHITIEEVPFVLLIVGVSFLSGAFAFAAGRRSARRSS
jgi:hypothetical protein